MQTILGAGGVIGKDLAKALMIYTDKIRLVSRNPQAINDNDELFSADLMDAQSTRKALEGSEIAYLTAGLPYSTKVWQAQWPVLMRNVIDACKANGTRLVFFSNVYALGRVEGWMKEETPMNPCSKKGAMRAQVEQMILDEVGKGNLEAIIARAADFYGPGAVLSFTDAMIFQNLLKGKKPQVLGKPEAKHTFTYTPDAARATAALGNTVDAYNQIWHLPTDPNPITNKAFAELAAQAFGAPAKSTPVPRFMVQLLGLFIPVLKESVEMLYQVEHDYLFDSSKYVKHFGQAPTPYAQGVAETVAYLRKMNGSS
jgi:nucleoside-diphosphate-sugar epimerase